MRPHDRESHQARVRSHRLRARIAIALLTAGVLVWLHRVVSLWVDRSTVFISALGLLIAIVLLFDWVLDLVGPSLWRFLKSIGKTMVRALASDPEILTFELRHPKISGWVRRRTTLSSWRGLYLTLTILAALYFLSGFIAIANGIATAGPITGYDPQITELLKAFRSPNLTRFLWVFTILGDPRVAFPLTGVAAVTLELWAHRHDALFVAASVSGGTVLGTLAKHLFERSRPAGAIALIATPDSYSFPSGHALYSMLIAFSLAFVLARRARTLRARLTTLGIAALFAFLTALSRVYLGVHWMSDTVASWLLGLTWLTVCVGALASYERYSGAVRERSVSDPRHSRLRLTLMVTVIAAFMVVYGALKDPLLTQATQTPAIQSWHVTSAPDGTPIPTRKEATVLPRWAENLDGSNMSPIGLIFVGSQTEILTAFDKAGWQLADQPNFINVLHSAFAQIGDRPYSTAPVSPSFLNGQVHQLAFEKSVGTASARRRHHTRWWRTDFALRGMSVWVATASLDTGVHVASTLPVPTHRIDPNIDAEQRFIVRSLVGSGTFRAASEVRVTKPTTGSNAAGDQWFTEGMATLLVPVR